MIDKEKLAKMKSLIYLLLLLFVQKAVSYAKWNCLICDIYNNKQCDDENDQGHEGSCSSSENNVGCLSVTQSKNHLENNQ